MPNCNSGNDTFITITGYFFLFGGVILLVEVALFNDILSDMLLGGCGFISLITGIYMKLFVK